MLQEQGFQDLLIPTVLRVLEKHVCIDIHVGCRYQLVLVGKVHVLLEAQSIVDACMHTCIIWM